MQQYLERDFQSQDHGQGQGQDHGQCQVHGQGQDHGHGQSCGHGQDQCQGQGWGHGHGQGQGQDHGQDQCQGQGKRKRIGGEVKTKIKRISRGPRPTIREKLGIDRTAVYTCYHCGGRTRALNGTYPFCNYCGKQWGRSNVDERLLGEK